MLSTRSSTAPRWQLSQWCTNASHQQQAAGTRVQYRVHRGEPRGERDGAPGRSPPQSLPPTTHGEPRSKSKLAFSLLLRRLLRRLSCSNHAWNKSHCCDASRRSAPYLEGFLCLTMRRHRFGCRVYALTCMCRACRTGFAQKTGGHAVISSVNACPLPLPLKPCLNQNQMRTPRGDLIVFVPLHSSENERSGAFFFGHLVGCLCASTALSGHRLRQHRRCCCSCCCHRCCCCPCCCGWYLINLISSIIPIHICTAAGRRFATPKTTLMIQGPHSTSHARRALAHYLREA